MESSQHDVEDADGAPPASEPHPDRRQDVEEDDDGPPPGWTTPPAPPLVLHDTKMEIEHDIEDEGPSTSQHYVPPQQTPLETPSIPVVPSDVKMEDEDDTKGEKEGSPQTLPVVLSDIKIERHDVENEEERSPTALHSMLPPQPESQPPLKRVPSDMKMESEQENVDTEEEGPATGWDSQAPTLPPLEVAPSVMSKSRGANMTPFEDESLCRAYLYVSIDSANGYNQTGGRLWEAISAKYHAKPCILISRTQNSLQSRFQTISTSVQYFMAKLNHVINTKGSGTNEVDWVNKARDAYQIEKNKHFVFYKCYQILKDHPRFDLNATCLNTQRSQFGPNESGGLSVDLRDDCSPIDIEAPASSKHMGLNEAKMQQKRKAKDKSLSVQNVALKRVEKFLEVYEQNLAKQDARHQELQQQIERLVQYREEDRQRNNREEQRRIRAEERKDAAAEDALLAMDLSRMNDQQRELYNYRINDLLARRR